MCCYIKKKKKKCHYEKGINIKSRQLLLSNVKQYLNIMVASLLVSINIVAANGGEGGKGTCTQLCRVHGPWAGDVWGLQRTVSYPLAENSCNFLVKLLVYYCEPLPLLVYTERQAFRFHLLDDPTYIFVKIIL